MHIFTLEIEKPQINTPALICGPKGGNNGSEKLFYTRRRRRRHRSLDADIRHGEVTRTELSSLDLASKRFEFLFQPAILAAKRFLVPLAFLVVTPFSAAAVGLAEAWGGYRHEDACYKQAGGERQEEGYDSLENLQVGHYFTS